MGKIAVLLRAGNKTEAIKVYRQAYGTNLVAAREAVERIVAGQIDPNSRATRSSLKFRLGLSLAITLFVTFIIAMIVYATRNAPNKSTPDVITPALGAPSVADNQAAPPPPSFADMMLEFGSDGIGAGQFKDARSIAVDNTGKIYVGDFSSGRIQVFDQSGKFLSEWMLGQGKYIVDLTADHSGNLYVVLPGKIVRYNAATRMPQNELDDDAPNNRGFRLDYADACASVSGDVYAVADADIVELNPQGKITMAIDESQKIGESLRFERIAVSGDGNIYALDLTNGIFKFAPDGRYINRFGGGFLSGPGIVFGAQGLAVDGQGRLFVACHKPAIQVFDADGRYIDGFGGNDAAFGLAINDQNEIFTSFGSSVRKYKLNKHPVQTP
jgi:DNA-binding beta-propeller fold protein YncE